MVRTFGGLAANYGHHRLVVHRQTTSLRRLQHVVEVRVTLDELLTGFQKLIVTLLQRGVFRWIDRRRGGSRGRWRVPRGLRLVAPPPLPPLLPPVPLAFGFPA